MARIIIHNLIVPYTSISIHNIIRIIVLYGNILCRKKRLLQKELAKKRERVRLEMDAGQREPIVSEDLEVRSFVRLWICVLRLVTV